ncbi:MAG: GNAT family N-acetyltransferase, partial [Candidatus Thorarchaeota archaeon]|nr:GNAT family N-acetyltransferase [Candidatus Thorarchaeota archaeon]
CSFLLAIGIEESKGASIVLTIATKNEFALRFATKEDFPRIDEITITCYQAIYDSWVAMHGKELHFHLNDPKEDWEAKKTKQNHDLFAKHPEWVWVLEKDAVIIGFVTFLLKRDKSIGIIENNVVLPEFAGKGLGKFMYRSVLQYFREQNIKYAHVETGLDSPHGPARKAYEGVGLQTVTGILDKLGLPLDSDLKDYIGPYIPRSIYRSMRL